MIWSCSTSRTLFDIGYIQKIEQLEKELALYKKLYADAIYYGSDLNKFMDKECSREMTVNNIDCTQYKRAMKIWRIIESKHSNEGMKMGQKELITQVIPDIFNTINKLGILKYRLEAYIVRGEPPYKFVKIRNLLTNIVKELNHQQLIEFSNFNYNPFV
jgi:hypothetical protein